LEMLSVALSRGGMRGVMAPVVCTAFGLTQSRNVSLKKTKQRIHASKNIEKITKAMKNVASARMKGAEQEALASYKFVTGVNQYLQALPRDQLDSGVKHIVVPVTSDKGLCGAVNSNVVRLLVADLKKEPKRKVPRNVSINVIGSKGKDQLMRFFPALLTVGYDEIQKKPVSFSQACSIADEILQQDFDTMSIYYTRFVNAGSQIPERMDLYSPAKVKELADSLDVYECEPDKNDIMEALNTFYFASNLYYCICTSIASEQASRMVAMDGASRNAKDMITKLRILYNRTRQSIITGQLIEITSAAEAIK